MPESESEGMQGRLQPRGGIDEKHRLINVMFFAECCEKHQGHRLISRRIEPHTQQVVSLGIDRCVQPEPFVVDLNHGLVHHDVIRIATSGRL